MQRAKRCAIGGLCSLVLVVGVAGAAGAAPTKAVPPNEWATSACTSGLPWIATIDGLYAQAFNLPVTDLVATRQVLIDMAAAAQEATTALIDAIDEAGTPAVKRGKKFVAAVSATFADDASLYEIYKGQAEALSPTDRPAYIDVTLDLGFSLDDAATHFSGTLVVAANDFPSKKLDRALTQPACTEILLRP